VGSAATQAAAAAEVSAVASSAAPGENAPPAGRRPRAGGHRQRRADDALQAVGREQLAGRDDAGHQRRVGRVVQPRRDPAGQGRRGQRPEREGAGQRQQRDRPDRCRLQQRDAEQDAPLRHPVGQRAAEQRAGQHAGGLQRGGQRQRAGPPPRSTTCQTSATVHRPCANSDRPMDEASRR
jgi:hypothetical protein